MNLSLAAAILDENLKGPTATFDELGLSAVRWAWETVKATRPAEISAGSPSEASASAPATDALIPPGFVVAPREATSEWIYEQALTLSSDKSEDAVGALAWNLSVAFKWFAALPPPGGGKGSSVAESAAASPSGCAATAPQCKSEGGEP